MRRREHFTQRPARLESVGESRSGDSRLFTPFAQQLGSSLIRHRLWSVVEGFCQHAFYWPACGVPLKQGSVGQSGLGGPVLKTLGTPLPRCCMDGASVSSLLCRSGPHTVTGGVGAIIIFTFYRMLWRGAGTHVLIKVQKPPQSEPSGGYRDVSPSVMTVRSVVGVVAAPLKGLPCYVFRAFVKIMSQATAAFGSVFHQLRSCSGAVLPAFTQAKPVAFAFIGDWFKGQQQT
jgi:hypothetical protein